MSWFRPRICRLSPQIGAYVFRCITYCEFSSKFVEYFIREIETNVHPYLQTIACNISTIILVLCLLFKNNNQLQILLTFKIVFLANYFIHNSRYSHILIVDGQIDNMNDVLWLRPDCPRLLSRRTTLPALVCGRSSLCITQVNSTRDSYVVTHIYVQHYIS